MPAGSVPTKDGMAHWRRPTSGSASTWIRVGRKSREPTHRHLSSGSSTLFLQLELQSRQPGRLGCLAATPSIFKTKRGFCSLPYDSRGGYKYHKKSMTIRIDNAGCGSRASGTPSSFARWNPAAPSLPRWAQNWRQSRAGTATVWSNHVRGPSTRDS